MAKERFEKPTGTQDVLPGAVEKWQYIEGRPEIYAAVLTIGKFAHLCLSTQGYSNVE